LPKRAQLDNPLHQEQFLEGLVVVLPLEERNQVVVEYLLVVVDVSSSVVEVGVFLEDHLELRGLEEVDIFNKKILVFYKGTINKSRIYKIILYISF